ncbi:hypothetical protein HETIRDRAFT_423004 [Heterobasidion irregulare TC 32-1]|uniref:Origin recognition complex subunit 5 n=1 Tax=Heterobasidion irregulare (strain TC 32-1) TaxID=747525 RepID=W4JP04_HETIT|nr:uncharacterized protein HETIRDRAFT_423004 [Heterobasidion irregulare TC 32-1]ETW75282.1 hypothetical protein HETIRDRAFT_423004 [Heterobasidion irregulare TC 32-1]
MANYQDHLEDIVRDLSNEYPGNEIFTSHLVTLITTYPPLFVYVHDPTTAGITCSLVETALQSISAFDPSAFDPEDGAPRLVFAQVNAITCFTPRLLYDTALNRLAKWRPQWEEGCENWPAAGGSLRYNDSFDGFMHGLRALRTELLASAAKENAKERNGKGKVKAKVANEDVRMILVVEKAERLKSNLPELIVPLTRLAESSQVDITTIFISEAPWDDMKPPLGASLDPYRMVIPPPTKQATIQLLNSYFSAAASSDSDVYNPSLAPLYAHFAQALYSVCSPFTNDPRELAYIAAARWPGFVQPVLKAHARDLAALREDDPDADLPLEPPSEDARMRLLRYFTPSLTVALEALYPRLTNAKDWANANMPEPGALDPGRSVPSSPRKDKGKTRDGGGDVAAEFDTDVAVQFLPRMSKFILVAAFLASTNPPKSDLRMFGRGVDDRRKRKKGGGTRKSAGKSGPAKIAQRLLGPMTFPLDRLLAILGILLEEYDYDSRPQEPEYLSGVPGEETELELGRVHVYGAVVELSTARLLHRTSPSDKLDGPPTFKCGISYDVAMALAKDLSVPLLDLMWDSS